MLLGHSSFCTFFVEYTYVNVYNNLLMGYLSYTLYHTVSMNTSMPTFAVEMVHWKLDHHIPLFQNQCC